MNTRFIQKGSGPPLLFLHGIASRAEGWQEQLQTFAPDYHVLALNLPGYGASPPLIDVTFDTLAAWLADFLKQQQLHQVTLVGHSFGGMIAQAYLARYPYDARLKALVLYGTSAAFGSKDGTWQQKFIQSRLGPLDEGKTLADLAPGIAKAMTGSAALPSGTEAIIRDIAATSEASFRHSVMCLVDFDERANLPHITVPTLAIVGEEDSNAPPNMMQRLSERMQDAQYCMLPGLGHMAHQENPALFNHHLRAFLHTLI